MAIVKMKVIPIVTQWLPIVKTSIKTLYFRKVILEVQEVLNC